MISRKASILCSACFSMAWGCGSDTSEDTSEVVENLVISDDQVVFRTDPFQLEPGEERFLCFALTLPQDLAIDGYDYPAGPTLHHLVFSRAQAPEPEGFSECDLLFRSSWDPLFLAGAGSSQISFPEGAAHTLEAGTQLVAQLHLLNVRGHTVTETAEIVMQRTRASDPIPVGTYVFGTTNISLPPNQDARLEADCTMDEPVELIAAFPHMHLLGRGMRFEVGASSDTMQQVFERAPFDFDDQSLELLELSLQPGDATRVTCEYENPYDEVITFGESTRQEMCFFIGFALNKSGLNGCFPRSAGGEEVPRDPAAGECGEHTPNDLGIGVACSRGGGECEGATSCSADLNSQGGDTGVCIQLGCASDEDCGGGSATCCAPSQGGGGVQICIPEACRPTNCIPLG